MYAPQPRSRHDYIAENRHRQSWRPPGEGWRVITWAEHAKGYLRNGIFWRRIKRANLLRVRGNAITLNAQVWHEIKPEVSVLRVTLEETGELVETSSATFEREKIAYSFNGDPSYALPWKYWTPADRVKQLSLTETAF